MLYLTLKWLHILAIISWMAGILYLYRLLVNHRDALTRGDPPAVTDLLQGMETRLYRIITVPSMSVATVLGLVLIGLNPLVARGGWLHIKLTCVVLLIGATIYAGRLMRKFPSAGTHLPTSKTLRIYNEIPTLLMAIIIAMVVFRPFS